MPQKSGLGIFPAVSLITGRPSLLIHWAQTLRASQHRASMDFPQQQPEAAAAITQTLFANAYLLYTKITKHASSNFLRVLEKLPV